jgi:hypothetical protein
MFLIELQSLLDYSGKSYWNGKLSAIYLHVLISLDQLILYWKFYLPLLQKPT